MRAFFVLSLLFLFQNIYASESASSMTPESAIERLKAGNQRYVQNQSFYSNTGSNRRAVTAKDGQKPYAVILTCADSRVPPEYIFDAGIGDVFIVRVAGNVADTDEIGTVEYGIEHLGASVVVVLGHSKCGAVTAVVKGDKVSENIAKLVDNIVPAVEKAKASLGKDDVNALIDASITENIWQSIGDMPVASNKKVVEIRIVASKIKVVENTMKPTRISIYAVL